MHAHGRKKACPSAFRGKDFPEDACEQLTHFIGKTL